LVHGVQHLAQVLLNVGRETAAHCSTPPRNDSYRGTEEPPVGFVPFFEGVVVPQS
jgi:hypothetical protein